INRADESEAFDLDAARLLEVLLPHLRRALLLHQRLTGLDAERAALADVLDRLRSGVILVDVDVRVVFVNRSAARLLDTRDGLTLDRSGVRGPTTAASAALTSALASAAAVAT